MGDMHETMKNGSKLIKKNTVLMAAVIPASLMRKRKNDMCLVSSTDMWII